MDKLGWFFVGIVVGVAIVTIIWNWVERGDPERKGNDANS